MHTGTRRPSRTSKSRTLYRGERMAAISAQPRATLSSAFMVVESSLLPKAAEHISLTQGTRLAPPTISTKSIWSKGRPQDSLAASSTFLTLAIIGLHMSRKRSRVMLEPKSSSSMRHSQLMPASLFAERIFFVFVTASSSLKEAFLLERGSAPTFFLNCAANSRMRHSSISRPPTLSDFSHTTVSLPFTNCTTDTEKMDWPMLQKTTVHGLSASNSFER
mmetsp:Transcript_97058/g.225001  ORF Transcript_97058/g.225001 Transcript_97058/m.225001 type:complete len:219 (+) Transcript_97058:1066-1722(+)